jgi:transposase
VSGSEQPSREELLALIEAQARAIEQLQGEVAELAHPVARTQALIADLTGARPSTGWISSVLTTVADLLLDVENLIKSLIVLAHVIHVDETSSNINGARWWLHVASTDKLTAYRLHPSQGRTAVTEFDVLPAFRGTVMHAALSIYDVYPDARHALRVAGHTARPPGLADEDAARCGAG